MSLEAAAIIDEYRPIDGLDNFGVSKEGIVIRLVDSPTGGHKKGKICKATPTITSPYLYVKLFQNGKTHQRSVHRLVAQAWIPNPYSLPEVNHKDGDKANNYVSNLEWVSRSENKLHSFRVLGHTGPREFVSSRCKVSNNDVGMMCKMYWEEGYLYKEIAQLFGISTTHVGRLIQGTRRAYLT